MTMTTPTPLVRAQHIPLDLNALTGIRIHGDSGVTPVDLGTARMVEAGGECWLYWTHQGIERAVSYRHLVEMFCDPHQLTVS